ncbi:MAG: hypothetical protein KGH71_02025 [Candidatus Micrarchaeota archaeon]|nr:hypothetical protein [Candidatus Micrarchaeota archaeon]
MYNTSNVENLKNSDSEVQRRRRYKQMKMEEDAAERLRKEGWQVFSPTVVCDRIAIKDNRVCFVEFKKPGQKLTENQEKIKNLADNYFVVQY